MSFLTGGFGVLSGYAVFFLCLEEANRPRLFAMALLIAAMLSTAYEWLRERIEAHGHGWSWSRVFTTMVMLAMAEFFVMVFHGTVMFEDLPAIARATMGEGVTRAEIADTEAEVTRPGTESPGAGTEVTHSNPHTR